jgi:DNA-binding MarR family transcriptional regulator
MSKCEDHFDDHLGKWVAVIHLTEMDILDRELFRFGLSRATFGVFINLYFEDGVRQDQLIREVKVNKSTITRAVQKLEELGYVTRQQDESDRRVYRVFQTDKARAIREEIMGILWRQSEKMLRGISKKRKTELFESLQVVYKNISDYRNELLEGTEREDED